MKAKKMEKKMKKALKKFSERNEKIKSIVILGEDTAEILPIGDNTEKDSAEDLIAIGFYLSDYEVTPIESTEVEEEISVENLSN